MIALVSKAPKGFGGKSSFLVSQIIRLRAFDFESDRAWSRFCYAAFMKAKILAVVALFPCWMALLMVLPAYADSTEIFDLLVVDSVPLDAAVEAQDLATIISNIAPVSQETEVRRNIAQATFCLPQNVLGTLLYGLLQLTGSVLDTADVNEVTIIVTRPPIGASLGRYIFLGKSVLTENAVRHEYGHTMQGYKHGPFYLLFEGLVSFVQAAFSLISPSFADSYFDRWPENEANELGGIT